MEMTGLSYQKGIAISFISLSIAASQLLTEAGAASPDATPIEYLRPREEPPAIRAGGGRSHSRDDAKH
jgi:hypothetical protein